MGSADKEDIVFAISTVVDAVKDLDTSDYRGGLEIGLFGSSGVLHTLQQINDNLPDGLQQLNKNLTVIKWLLAALLAVAVFALVKR